MNTFIKNLVAVAVVALGFGARGADVNFDLTKFNLTAGANRKVIIRPVADEGVPGKLLLSDAMSFNSGTNGSFWISNMVTGTYQLEIQGPPSTTILNFKVTPTDVVQGAWSNLVASSKNTIPAQTFAWSASASDARYALKGEEVATNGLSESQSHALVLQTLTEEAVAYVNQVAGVSNVLWARIEQRLAEIPVSTNAGITLEQATNAALGVLSQSSVAYLSQLAAQSNALRQFAMDATNSLNTTLRAYADGVAGAGGNATNAIANLEGLGTNTTFHGTTWFIGTNAGNGRLNLYDSLSNVLAGFNGSYWHGLGLGLTGLNASALASGKVPLERLPAGIGTGTGSSNITDVGYAAVARNLSVSTNFSAGSMTITGQVTAASVQVASIAGSADGLTNLNASALASGTVPLERLPAGIGTGTGSSNITDVGYAAVARNLSVNTNFSAGSMTITGQVTAASVQVASIGGSAAGLSNVPMSGVTGLLATWSWLTNNPVLSAFYAPVGATLTVPAGDYVNVFAKGSDPYLIFSDLDGSWIVPDTLSWSIKGAFFADAGNLTNANASTLLGSGTVPWARLPSGIITNGGDFTVGTRLAIGPDWEVLSQNGNGVSLRAGQATIANNESVAIGVDTGAEGQWSFAAGDTSHARAVQSVAWGLWCEATNTASWALGMATKAFSPGAVIWQLHPDFESAPQLVDYGPFTWGVSAANGVHLGSNVTLHGMATVDRVVFNSANNFSEPYLESGADDELILWAEGGGSRGKLWAGNIQADSITMGSIVLSGPTNSAPANTTTIRAWANFTNTAGGVFKYPLYQ